MPVVFTRGDLFATPADVRVNTVNCVGVMGAGIALAFKKRYPAMFREYKKACKAGQVQPGRLHLWRDPATDQRIINFPTKRHWRQPSRYEDVEAGLIALHAYLENVGKVSVALPALGAGNGGLDWENVKLLINKHLSDVDAQVYVFAPLDSIEAGRRAKNAVASDVERNSGAADNPSHNVRPESDSLEQLSFAGPEFEGIANKPPPTIRTKRTPKPDLGNNLGSVDI